MNEWAGEVHADLAGKRIMVQPPLPEGALAIEITRKPLTWLGATGTITCMAWYLNGRRISAPAARRLLRRYGLTNYRPHLPWAFPWLLARAEAVWVEAELPGGPGGGAPPYVVAVAQALGLDAQGLWDHVEGLHGWESHDAGFGQAVWDAAYCTDDHRLAGAVSHAIATGRLHVRRGRPKDCRCAKDAAGARITVADCPVHPVTRDLAAGLNYARARCAQNPASPGDFISHPIPPQPQHIMRQPEQEPEHE